MVSTKCVSGDLSSTLSSDIVQWKKKALNVKRLHWSGRAWELLQVFLSILASIVYVAESYAANTYSNVHIFFILDVALTQFFTLDFVINWIIADSTLNYFTTFMTYIDMITIIPVYVSMTTDAAPDLAFLRFIRILRIVRVFRTFRVVGGLGGIKKQLLSLTLTLFCLIFVAAGIFCILENDLNQLHYECKYIAASTGYKPSCSPSAPADDACDCSEHHCEAAYTRRDTNGQPSLIVCRPLYFLDAYYFIIVTISTVGYGDISPTSVASRVVIVLFIITSLVVIPAQVNRVTSLLSATSIFRRAYIPQNNEEHVILCGYVSDRRKLERFLREFFHPDRFLRGGSEHHIVILGTTEPSDDVKDLLLGPVFDARVTYLTGSPMNSKDLQRARADMASAVFFLCNNEANVHQLSLDGNELVLNVLAVTDYNPNVNCLVQVVQSHSSDILKHSEVDVVICLDEFKTVILARNAVCHGLSTMVDNLFRTFGGLDAVAQDGYWLKEYHTGAAIEVYYVPLPKLYLEVMRYDWSMIVEGIFLEFDCILLGVTDTLSNAVYLNACDNNGRNIFRRGKRNPYLAGILLSSTQHIASAVATGLNDYSCVERIVSKMIDEECCFGIRQFPSSSLHFQKRQSRRFSSLRGDSSQFQSQEFQEMHRFQERAMGYKMSTTSAKSPNRSCHVSGSSNFSDSSYGDSTAHKEVATDFRSTPLLSDDIGVELKQSEKVISTGDNRNAEMRDAAEKGYIRHALNIVDHVIVFGCLDYLHSFIEYAQTPTQKGYSSHCFVIVSKQPYPHVSLIRKRHNNVFFMQGDITSKTLLSMANISSASTLVMLASRNPTKTSTSNEQDRFMDFDSLYMFLKLSSCIPPNVFFTVELTCTENMSVLNSAAIRKEKQVNLEARAIPKNLSVSDAFYSLNLRMRRMVNQYNSESTDTLEKAMVNHDFRRITHNPQQKIGVFTSQYVDKLNKLRDVHVAELLSKNAGRRLSSILFRQFDFDTNGNSNIDTPFWDNLDAHIDLPIFASGRAFVPNLVDNLLCQSFFAGATIKLCEALVCGQNTQTMFLIPVPLSFVDRYFKDLFRAFASRNVLILGIYRAPQMSENSTMPFVFTCPPMKSALRVNDFIYAYGDPREVKSAELLLKKPFKRRRGMCCIDHDFSLP